MAGGMISKPDPKKKANFMGFTSEVLKDSQSDYQATKPEPKVKFSLSGILGLNQTVEIAKSQDKKVNFLVNHLEKEQKTLFDSRQQELEKQITALQSEIQKLTKVTEDLDKEVANVALTPIPQVSEYQINFLQRVRIFIENFRQNISSASLWLESLIARKRKRNYYWSMFKSKKGGEQYLFSGEHSAARSAT
jgi:hypothetical protein